MYWASFLIPKFISQQSFLKYSAILGLILTTLTYFTTGSTAVTFIALLGLANAVMWPAIFPLAINGLGRFTQIGSAILIMGYCRGALCHNLWNSGNQDQLPISLPDSDDPLLCLYLVLCHERVWGKFNGQRTTTNEQRTTNNVKGRYGIAK